MVYCPECNTPTENGDPTSTNVFCGQCHHWFCTQCREPGHRDDCSTFDDTNHISNQGYNRPAMHLPGMISTDAREREVKRRRKKEERETLNELNRSDKTKQCPGCKIWIEKNLGCNHMTCKNCNVSIQKFLDNYRNGLT